MIEEERRSAAAWLAAIQEPDHEAVTDGATFEAASVACRLIRQLVLDSDASQDETEQATASAGRSVLLVLRLTGVVPGRVAHALSALRDAIRGESLPRSDADTHAEAFLQLNAIVAQQIAEDGARTQRELTGKLEVFARTLSHELKNPLGAADGAVHMLLDDSIAHEAGQRKRFAEMIARNLRRALELLNDVRALAEAEPRRGPTRIRSLRSIIEDVVHEVSATADDRQVSVSILEPIPDARLDASRVTLVLMNLAWNAVKYSDPSKPHRWARIGVTAADGDWHCFVADNGLGIPADAQEQVFEAFHRAHPQAATGTGLGLSIARETVTQLGGKLWLESVPGMGTTFHFTVPGTSAEDAG